MENKKSNKQPTPKKGFEFTGWATFNWGICHNHVYRTRKQAKEALCGDYYTWDELKDNHKIIKVKCTVL